MTPRTVVHQAPLLLEFPRQEYWSGLPFPTPGGLPDPGIKLVFFVSPALAGKFFTTESPGKPKWCSQPVWAAVAGESSGDRKLGSTAPKLLAKAQQQQHGWAFAIPWRFGLACFLSLVWLHPPSEVALGLFPRYRQGSQGSERQWFAQGHIARKGQDRPEAHVSELATYVFYLKFVFSAMDQGPKSQIRVHFRFCGPCFSPTKVWVQPQPALFPESL